MKNIAEYLRILLFFILCIILVQNKLFIEGSIVALYTLFLLMKLRLKKLELRVNNLEGN